eukprot:3591637-Rhodomonas_salina.1
MSASSSYPSIICDAKTRHTSLRGASLKGPSTDGTAAFPSMCSPESDSASMSACATRAVIGTSHH